MREYIVVNRSKVTFLIDEGNNDPDIIVYEIMTVIEVITKSDYVESWGAYRGIVSSVSLNFADRIKLLVKYGYALQKHEAIASIQGKPLGWNLENCRYDNGLFE